MKKIFHIIAVFFLLSVQFYGADKFSLDVSGGIINGRTTEYVYDASRFESNYHLSELYYDTTLIPCIELNLKFMPVMSWFIQADGLVGYPKSSGNLQRLKYLNGLWDDEIYYAGGNLSDYTFYAKHENKVTNFLSASLSAGHRFYCPYDFQFEPYLKYQFEYISYEGNNGYKNVLDPKSREFTKTELTGRICTYDIFSNIAALGVNIDIQFFLPFLFRIGGEISPYLCFTQAYDVNYEKNIEYKDEFILDLRAKALLEAMYKFSGNKIVGLRGIVTYQPEKYDTSDKTEENPGGIELFYTEVSIFYKISFK